MKSPLYPLSCSGCFKRFEPQKSTNSHHLSHLTHRGKKMTKQINFLFQEKPRCTFALNVMHALVQSFIWTHLEEL